MLWSLVPNTKCSSSGDSRVCSPSSSSDHSHNDEAQHTKLTEPGGNISVSKGNPSPWTLAAINKNKYNIIMSMQIRYNTTDGSRKPETKYKCWPPSPGDWRQGDEGSRKKVCLEQKLLAFNFKIWIIHFLHHLRSSKIHYKQQISNKMLANENLWETSLQPLRTMPNADAVIGIIIKSGTDMVSLEHEGSKVYRS